MTQNEAVFFSILRSALWQTPMEIPEGFNKWGSIMKMALYQTQMGLIGDKLLTTPEIRQTLDPNFVNRLRIILKQIIVNHNHMNIRISLLVSTLREHKIEPVLLKGLGLAQYYPTPELRQCGDIDLYVREEDYESSYDAIKPIVTSIDDKSKIWGWMHYDAMMDTIPVEVHHKADHMRSRKTERLYKQFMLDGLSKDLPSMALREGEILTPNPNFNAFYIFYHLWRHFTGSGVGLRQFCDWACFLHAHAGKLDSDYLKNILDTLGFMRPWQVQGAFLVNELGLPQEEFPLYNEKYLKLSKKVRKYVLTDGNFGMNLGKAKEKKGKYILDKFTAFKFHISRVFRMLAIFPKHTCLVFWYMIRDGVAHIFKDLHRFISKRS